MADVVIIGAGLTGLSAAYHLEKLGFFDYKIFERDDRPGGLLKSVHRNGFTFDQTGHWLHVNNPEFKTFLDTIASSPTHLSLIERKAGIFSHNAITEYPFQSNLFGLPTNVIAECIQGYVTRHTHIKNPINFYQWVLKNFGTGIGKHFFFPYNKKLSAYNLKKMHHSWTSRFVPPTSLHAIIHGAIENNAKKNVGYNGCFYYPKTGGIEFIIKQITAQLTNTVATQHEVTHIDAKQKIVFFQNGTHERYRQLITTMPLDHLVNITKTDSSTNTERTASKLLCNSVININLGFKTQLAYNSHWLYFPENMVPWYRIGFWSNIAPWLAPAGQSSIYNELSYLPNKINNHKLTHIIDTTQQKLLSFLGFLPQAIATQHVFNIRHAYVIYDLWREKNINGLLERLKTNNIHSIGRYGAWKYSSMQEAFLDGKNGAEQLLPFVASKMIKVIPALRDKKETINRHHRHQKSTKRSLL